MGWLSTVATGSNIATFKDESCSQSIDNLSGPNGYPNGTCTRLSLGTLKSFQVVNLDKGCAVTIYGPDEDPAYPCSSTQLQVAEIAQCYNTSWVYYSIDGCDIPTTTPSATPLITDSTPPPTGVASSSATSSATAAPRSSHTGIIIGGIVGGVALFALILFGVAFYYRRRYSTAKRLPPPPPPPPSYELSNNAMLVELQYPEKTVQTEMWAHEPAQEIGRNSSYQPPAELPGDAVAMGDKERREKEATMRNMI
ncbi:hypothetical protein P154DRAFT_540316 [Amniculicola lignicola CBS 123094]|uniref:Mid2 domain-containing protein n=1 Tax=Amniculicola lignicola CBS 123094 TaxID=1392246 RepID=A0A6A5W091_9PLEO|nr:hypothetical protein P154DRAFT_540316 [Amniculicola lignicola CBS 123094]